MSDTQHIFFLEDMKEKNFCNAFSIIDKVSNLLIRTSDKITDKLKNIPNTEKLYSETYASGPFKGDYYCTMEINGVSSPRKDQYPKSGNSPNIFYGIRLLKAPKKLEIENYPTLIVCLHNDVINDEGKKNKTYVDSDNYGDWYYFGIDESILASINYEEDFIKEVVRVVSTYYNGN